MRPGRLATLGQRLENLWTGHKAIAQWLAKSVRKVGGQLVGVSCLHDVVGLEVMPLSDFLPHSLLLEGNGVRRAFDGTSSMKGRYQAIRNSQVLDRSGLPVKIERMV